MRWFGGFLYISGRGPSTLGYFVVYPLKINIVNLKKERKGIRKTTIRTAQTATSRLSLSPSPPPRPPPDQCRSLHEIGMASRSIKRLINCLDYSSNLPNIKDVYKKRFAYSIFSRNQSHLPKGGDMGPNVLKEGKDSSNIPINAGQAKKIAEISKYSSDEDESSDSKWKLELAWLSKALEPALQFFRWAIPTGYGYENSIPPVSRSFSEILASFQRSKAGLQDWSLSDLTIGLYLVYLRQASSNTLEDVKGDQICSEQVVHDLIYHIELAKGCYKGNAGGLAKHSMLREGNVLKFVKHSSVLRPGYYIAIDPRKKLVILGIRGTHTVYDLITDIVTQGNNEINFEGYCTHFGTAEAARWFLTHEMGLIKKCLDENEGFRLRMVGHSLGAAIASLLAIMLRKKSTKELGFNPDIVTAVGFATPPCLSKELAESCSNYVSTVVMQDDIIPRLSMVTLGRLRNEIVQTDWKSVLENEDFKSVVEFVTNAKQVMLSVQDAARKVADYAKFRGTINSSDSSMITNKSLANPNIATSEESTTAALVKKVEATPVPANEELFVPGAVYYLKRNLDSTSGHTSGSGSEDGTLSTAVECFTLWKRHPGEHFQRILLSNNLISDHKCDSHLYALRDVLKGFPGTSSSSEGIFS